MSTNTRDDIRDYAEKRGWRYRYDGEGDVFSLPPNCWMKVYWRAGRLTHVRWTQGLTTHKIEYREADKRGKVLALLKDLR